MKKILLILFVFGLVLLYSNVFADVVTTRKLNSTTSTYQTQNTQNTVTIKRTKLANNVKTCVPYSENAQFDVNGVNFVFNIKIAGWTNNKCRMDFTSNANGISDSFKSLYGVDASQAEVVTFAPKFRCEFTKQQLAQFGDSILQEEERKNGATNNMLKNPNQINVSQFSQKDLELASLLFDGSTCTMLNSGELNNLINSLF
jgi:hypothetical protein